MTERRSSGPKRRGPSTRQDDATVKPADGRRLTEGRLLFLVVAAVVLVYSNSLGGQFLVDDADDGDDDQQLD